MSRKENKYGIALVNILATGLNSSKQNDQRTAFQGTIMKIENILGNGNVSIRFLDKTNTSFEETTYCCKSKDLVSIAEVLWPLLVAIPSPIDRKQIACNITLCDSLSMIKKGTYVEVLHNKTYRKAIVRYIGPIPTMGVGHFFGLELETRVNLTKYDGSYGNVCYFNTLPGTGLFVSVDKLKPVLIFLSSINKKYEANFPTYDSTSLTNDEKSSHRLTQEDSSDVDLIELLGGSWPDARNVPLENRSASISEARNIPVTEHVKLVRNKSINPISHLINNKKPVKVKTDDITSPITDSKKDDPVSDDDISYYDTPGGTLTVGTLVEVNTDVSPPLYGVIRWLGNDGSAGVELEEDHEHLPLDLTDGMHKGQRYFKCAQGRALFVPVKQCQKDSRFLDGANNAKMFGQVDSPVIPGAVPPLSMPTEEDVLAVCGKYRGIQGHHNSCYLDATLFAMFTYTGVFDSLLFRPRTDHDIAHYEEVQRVLREEIVNPLRQNLFVRADRVMKLRTLLEDLSSVRGLTSEEKDPEEFLNSLLAQILKAEPFLKLSSGQEAFHYQLFVEKDEGLELPSVQQLFEQSFLSSDIKLKEVPSCLIIQMPRFGKSFKMYPRILPSALLDVTDIIENSPRQCTVCGKLAQYECRECFAQCDVGLESTGFCSKCLETAHLHDKRSSHSPRPLTVPQDFVEMAEHCPPPRLYMELFAVVCIETSHYVAFVKCGSGHEAPWCFFDSMADRKGEVNGYNIPEMVACPDVSNWLSDDGAVSRLLHEATPNDKQLPEFARRLLCDAYICMYQSPDVMMYR